MSAWSILADENVDRAIVDRLRADGHDVEYIEEVAKSDADFPVLDRAIAEQRILLTRDLDFGRYIYGDHLPAPGEGILQLRIDWLPPDERIAIVSAFFATHAPAESAGFFVTIADGSGTFRKRPLPR